MKTTITFAVLVASILAACATAPEMPQRSDQDVARLMSISDNLIVPREGRVGRIFLGMTEEQLYQRMGSPERTTHGYWSDVQQDAPNYIWGGLTVSVLSGKVFNISVSSPSYQTVEGVSLGTPELAAKVKLGQPVWDVLEYTDRHSRKLCFNPAGLIVIVDDGQVTRIELRPGDCK